MTQAARRRARRNIQEADFSAVLEPIRRMYRQTTAGERAALLVSVITEITK